MRSNRQSLSTARSILGGVFLAEPDSAVRGALLAARGAIDDAAELLAQLDPAIPTEERQRRLKEWDAVENV